MHMHLTVTVSSTVVVRESDGATLMLVATYVKGGGPILGLQVLEVPC